MPSVGHVTGRATIGNERGNDRHYDHSPSDATESESVRGTVAAKRHTRGGFFGNRHSCRPEASFRLQNLKMNAKFKLAGILAHSAEAHVKTKHHSIDESHL